MISKKKRYLLIGLFFSSLAVISAVLFFKSGADNKNFSYALICAFIGVLFLKHARRE
jgi:membrane protein YqaA with SNARE-associated domain